MHALRTSLAAASFGLGALIAFGAAIAPSPLAAQSGGQTMVYRLGRDTVAVERHTRTTTQMTGEVVSRAPAVRRLQYEVTLGANGRATSAVMRVRGADGAPLANQPTETRLTFTADSVRRELVWPDSTQRRAIAAPNALFVLPWPSVATLELLAAAQRAAPADSFRSIGTGAQAGWFRLAPDAGDTLRLRGGPYPFRVTFDASGRLSSLDGTLTANKVTGARATSPIDLATLAARMTPMGQASARGTATGPFNWPIFIDYGRPMVRDRSVWGGVLVPFDSVWRAGANAATHLATSRAITIGDVALNAGLYSLWVEHTRAGTFLLINSGIGQWGTSYNPAQTIGRVPMEVRPSPDFVEEFTIAIRSTGGSRGAIDFAWGPSVATATFALRQQ